MRNSSMDVMRRRAARRNRLESDLNRQLQALKSHPDVIRVVLFGSLARGNAGAHADIDLVVVMKTDRKFSERLDELYRLLQPRVATDILAYTPEEYKLQSAFLRRVKQEGTVLHEYSAA